MVAAAGLAASWEESHNLVKESVLWTFDLDGPCSVPKFASLDNELCWELRCCPDGTGLSVEFVGNAGWPVIDGGFPNEN